MISYEVWVAIVLGSFRDPILWIVAFIFGWDVERESRRTSVFLIVAGLIWGGIRVSVYTGRGAELSSAEGLVIIGVCVFLMVGIGGVIGTGRRWYSKR